MGHMAGKDIYRRLGEKIDNLTVKSPWNEALHNVLKELYSESEADLVVQMPYQLSSVDRIAGITGVESARLQDSLKAMAEKGLVLDLYHEGQYYYMPSPFMVGIFEFTMMRTGSNYSPKAAAELFHAYLSGSDDFYRANAGDGQQMALARAVPYLEAVAPEDVVEILSYEKVEAIVENHEQYAIGTCACRHEKQHSGQKTCAIPLDTCTSFGYAADYLIRHHMAAQVSREQVLENINAFLSHNKISSFDNIISSGGLFGKAKAIKDFLSQQALDSQEVVYVGDECRDIIACQKNKVRVIAVTWGYDSEELLAGYHPDALVHHPLELCNAILRSNAG
jgi:hypothetical protein